MEIRKIKIIGTVVAILLFIPFVSMQFTDEVDWSFFDFVLAGILLFTAGFLCDLVLRKISKVKYRILLCIVILFVFLFVWAEIAVGILDIL
jgi:hypothetical protein